ncbi:glycosyltransferase family 2 protein [Candidatus Saccharibacteria bacterium]|nr:glycosyltransferase family 2 protein [Candidatus Saccharibacteria bacterium]
MGKQLVSIIIPVHSEAGNLAWHHQKISDVITTLQPDFEIIYVDDGSEDESLDAIKSLAKSDERVHYISFSRNFGKEAASSAGLSKCKGDAAVMIDADGQHPIDYLGEFLKKWQSGYQVVVGIRTANAKEGLVKKIGSKVFYKLLNAISDGETIPRSTDFRLLDRLVIDEFNKLTERSRITRGLVDWLGYRRTFIEFEAQARHSGKATYGFNKLVKLALHAFVSQTTKPLRFIGFLGGLVTFISAIAGLFLLVEKYVFGDPLGLAVTGTALLALFVSLLVGLVLISNWLLALYVESIHNETQNRPLYIISEQG